MTTARALTFTAPWPYKGLSPNDRCHWAKKARAVAEYRRDVAACLLESVGVGNVPKLECAAVELEFLARTATRHDIDNLQAAFKAGQDGLVDAGLLPDDSSYHLRIEAVTCRKAVKGEAPGVRVTVREETQCPPPPRATAPSAAKPAPPPTPGRAPHENDA